MGINLGFVKIKFVKTNKKWKNFTIRWIIYVLLGMLIIGLFELNSEKVGKTIFFLTITDLLIMWSLSKKK